MEQICFVKALSKKVSGIPVLDNINLELYKGDIHALIGDDGIGKSMLMRILSGEEMRDKGEILMHGENVTQPHLKRIRKYGIYYLSSESLCVPDMTVLENLFLYQYPVKGIFKTLDHETAKKKAKEAFSILELDVPLDKRAGELGVAEQKLVRLASALCEDVQILLLDEADSGLGEFEIARLYKEMRKLADEGVGVLWATKEYKSVIEYANQVTMINKGKIDWSLRNSGKTEAEIKKRIEDSYSGSAYPKYPKRSEGELLRVESLSDYGILKEVSFSLDHGEILGILGTAGSGRTSLARCICGIRPLRTGEIFLSGDLLRSENEKMKVKNGIGLVEELIESGLVPELTAIQNVSLSNLDGVSNVLIDLELEKSSIAYYLKKLGVAKENWELPVSELSRADQKKILLARCLFADIKLLVMDEPTLGLGQVAKTDIYNIMGELVENDIGIILISSDFSELAGMSDRVLILKDGKLSKILEGKDITVAKMMNELTI